MKNLKIGKKLFVTFTIILCVFLTAVVVSIFGLTYGGSQFKDFYEYSYPLSNRTLDVRRGLQTSIKALGLSILTDDIQETETYIEEVNTEMAGVSENLNYLLENFRGDTSRIQTALNDLLKAKEYRIQIQELSAANKNDEASKIFFEQYSPLVLEVRDMMAAMDENTTALADSTYENANSVQTVVVILAIIASAIAVLLTIVMALYLSKMIKRPIMEIEAAANQMAGGKMDAVVTYTSKDELGSLSNSIRTLISNLRNIIIDVDFLLSEIADGNFRVKSKDPDGYVGDFNGMLVSMRKLRDSLSDTLSQINQSADQVSAGSEQVSSGSQALSQGATEQASSVEELAATINEISLQVKENAQSAQQGSELAETAGSKIEEGNRQMQELITAMSEISDKSGQIGKIIKTIEDIAFQTNILALNAAVEAARAGAAGKGFAVVADEVRNLASKSAEASKSTAALIEGSIQAVERGTKLADETAHTLTEVVDSAKQVVTVVEGISKASNEQASSVAQVTQGIEQISSVVQTNSATAEESAAASEELSGQAQMLKSLVEKFQLLQTGERNSFVAAQMQSNEKAAPLPFASGKY